MAALDHIDPLPARAEQPFRARGELRRAIGLGVVWALVLGNTAAIVWLWVHGGNVTTKSTGDVLTSIARST